MSIFSRVLSCALGCSCVELLDRCTLIRRDEPLRQAKVFKAHAAPQGVRENVINALKLLASQQKDGDSPIQWVARSTPTGRSDTP